MAISETTLKDTILFLIEEQNKKGGVMGKKLKLEVGDDACDPKQARAVAEQARSGLFPTVNAGSSAFRTRSPSGSGASAVTSNNYDLAASASWEP
jgi:hypothetical protein